MPANPGRAQLFDLPYFLVAEVAEPPQPDVHQAAFALTGHFLQQRVLDPRGLKLADARESLLAILALAPGQSSGTGKPGRRSSGRSRNSGG